VICADARDVLPRLPDSSIDAVITDPPWPDTSVDFTDGVDPFVVFSEVCQEIPRLTDRFIVILGCDTDPRFLTAISEDMPFFRTCWLRRIPPSYRGPLLYTSDVAYVFGARWLNGTSRVMPGEVTAVLQKDRDDKNPHPTKRHLHHMSWLIRHFTCPGHLVLDPFCGSGSTLVAARLANRRYCGIDIDQPSCDYALKRLLKPDLFHQGIGV